MEIIEDRRSVVYHLYVLQRNQVDQLRILNVTGWTTLGFLGVTFTVLELSFLGWGTGILRQRFEALRVLDLEHCEIYARHEHDENFPLIVNAKRAVCLQKKLAEVCRNSIVESPVGVFFPVPYAPTPWRMGVTAE